jgi:hypothetical protein
MSCREQCASILFGSSLAAYQMRHPINYTSSATAPPQHNQTHLLALLADQVLQRVVAYPALQCCHQARLNGCCIIAGAAAGAGPAALLQGWVAAQVQLAAVVALAAAAGVHKQAAATPKSALLTLLAEQC